MSRKRQKMVAVPIQRPAEEAGEAASLRQLEAATNGAAAADMGRVSMSELIRGGASATEQVREPIIGGIARGRTGFQGVSWI